MRRAGLSPADGAQAEERGDVTLPVRAARRCARGSGRGRAPAEQGGITDDFSPRVQRMDWGRTTRALLAFMPWWRRLALVIFSGRPVSPPISASPSSAR